LRGDQDLVVLDEPSSGLDAEAEYQIHQSLQAGRSGVTVLISHRLNTIRTAGQILVMQDGAIIERGSHDELIGLGHTYARMFRYQAAGYSSVPVASNSRVAEAEPAVAGSHRG
jgi:ATP-binding cassette, subfamily B, bacterial